MYTPLTTVILGSSWDPIAMKSDKEKKANKTRLSLDTHPLDRLKLNNDIKVTKVCAGMIGKHFPWEMLRGNSMEVYFDRERKGKTRSRNYLTW